MTPVGPTITPVLRSKSRGSSSATPHPTTHLNERTNEAHTTNLSHNIIFFRSLVDFFYSVIYLCCFITSVVVFLLMAVRIPLSFTFFLLFSWVVFPFRFYYAHHPHLPARFKPGQFTYNFVEIYPCIAYSYNLLRSFLRLFRCLFWWLLLCVQYFLFNYIDIRCTVRSID